MAHTDEAHSFEPSMSPIDSSNANWPAIISAASPVICWRRRFWLTSSFTPWTWSSGTPGTVEFRRAVRLGMPAALQLEAERISREREPLIAAGQHEADWRASRSFAIVMLRGRLPSMHALENYREAFAEIGAHLVLDDNARTQFEPRVIQYFNRSVSDRMQ